MNLSQINSVYFIGIGGIGMSALARYFKNIGKNVAGYDKTPTALTDDLIRSGFDIHFTDDVALIPKSFSADDTLVVITPAIPKGHFEWEHFKTSGYTIMKRAQVLGLITQNTFSFAVAGTHGKTTTSSILGHLLYQAGVDMTAFVGGIVENYNSNLIGSGKTVTVVEADEFDRSFLHLHPDMACVTSMDADHLDIYGTVDSIQESFREFAAKITNKRNLFAPVGLPLDATTVGIEQPANYRAHNIRIEDGAYVFDVQTPDKEIVGLKFSLPGRHNLMNAMMALAMADTYGVEPTEIAKGLASFSGIRRRFSYQIRRDDRVYVDDYAHHPTEIDSVHHALRELYPDDKILIVFQPHLFSRTRDFADGFAKSLSAFDEVLLLDIYPARELPIEGVTSQWLLEKIDNDRKRLITKADLIQAMRASDARVLATVGAGDIGELVPEIKLALS
jgi:UDP-N-acetylmuramate--alanine ligase